MNASASRLSGITKDLWAQWQQTKAYWRDAKAEEFEQKYIGELVSAVDKTIAALEKLDKLVVKIRKDCE